ncbi:MAG: ExbD/TolR family protein [Gemmobacter sp.]
MRRAKPPRPRPEPTIALINVVFLMLIFFLVAGQVAAPLDREVTLVEADTIAARVPDDVLVLRRDGTTLWRGDPMDPEAFAVQQGTPVLRLLPDRDVPARDLVAVAGRLRAAGAQEVRLVTARGVP